MTITIDSKLEAQLRERAKAEGLTVAAYLERLVQIELLRKSSSLLPLKV
jgi:hypothetical protein